MTNHLIKSSTHSFRYLIELMVPFVRTRGRGARGDRAAGGERPAARRERPAHRDDVRAAVERACSPRSSSSTSTASRSARTTSPSSRSAWTATPAWWPTRFDERDARGQGAAVDGDPAPAASRASTSASAARGPSDHPDFARWLMEQGIESLSLNPDTVVVDLAGAGGSRRRSGAQRLRSSFCFSRCHSFSRSAARLSCLSLPCASPISSLMRPFAEVQVERDQRVAALLAPCRSGAGSPRRAAGACGCASGPACTCVDAVASGRDVRADQPELAPLIDDHVGVADLRAPGADGLHLPALAARGRPRSAPRRSSRGRPCGSRTMDMRGSGSGRDSPMKRIARSAIVEHAAPRACTRWSRTSRPTRSSCPGARPRACASAAPGARVATLTRGG